MPTLPRLFLRQPAASPDEIATINKELSKMEDCIHTIAALRAKREEMKGLKSILDDAVEDEEMHKLAIDEFRLASSDELELQHQVLFMMLPRDEADRRGCILEVRAGTGGEEASLFAMDIFKMYERFAQKQSWRFEVLDVTETDLRGYKEASASITGDGVYGKLKFESGVHRVQRVPVTEKQGRVHTSAASVAVLPQADELDVQLRPEDLRIDTYRAGGAGGQHTNTTNSAVRITHIPTGTVVAIQDERSQHQNKAKALKVLRAKIYEKERLRQQSMRSNLRQEQIGSGDRSERIRTYNFPQGRVTDHRVGITQHSIEHILQGEGIDNFIDALEMKQEMDALALLKVGMD
ncbi:peptide chain release factor 1 [Marchantia polymorpha subsp. ruderalis]|uniref:Peptide chain release factor domain-containing protein n=2 Tax=Marchantia polymorpha TaxID=3197 RepID=A0AAF6BM79_MARPO|nr:hypothetical protein MARPO_0052s0112 [Marchantia polymorpha]BBN13113.1 hypothetical protein Mp_6g00910 [Marchantia polymorpha subsp. ruderalis]|eukprot:PTQ38334.1 hypothetical protein MARPO_0052s0112 [Marchantia polymorpha]